jgi:hypothetical protein
VRALHGEACFIALRIESRATRRRPCRAQYADGRTTPQRCGSVGQFRAAKGSVSERRYQSKELVTRQGRRRGPARRLRFLRSRPRLPRHIRPGPSRRVNGVHPRRAFAVVSSAQLTLARARTSYGLARLRVRSRSRGS